MYCKANEIPSNFKANLDHDIVLRNVSLGNGNNSTAREHEEMPSDTLNSTQQNATIKQRVKVLPRVSEHKNVLDTIGDKLHSIRSTRNVQDLRGALKTKNGNRLVINNVPVWRPSLLDWRLIEAF